MISQTKITSPEDCPCGIMSIPSGDYMSLSAMTGSTVIESNILVNRESAQIKSQEKFTTISDYFSSNASYNPDSLVLSRNDGYGFTLDNVIQLRVLEYPLNIPLHVSLLGNFGHTTNLGNEIVIPLNPRNRPDIDVNIAYILEFSSMCDFGIRPCCDSLPNSLPIDGYLNICIPLSRYYDLGVINPVTTTTLPPDFIGNPCS